MKPEPPHTLDLKTCIIRTYLDIRVRRTRDELQWGPPLPMVSTVRGNVIRSSADVVLKGRGAHLTKGRSQDLSKRRKAETGGLREKNSGGGGGSFDAAPRAKVDRATLAIEDDAGGDRVHCVVTGKAGDEKGLSPRPLPALNQLEVKDEAR